MLCSSINYLFLNLLRTVFHVNSHILSESGYSVLVSINKLVTQCLKYYYEKQMGYLGQIIKSLKIKYICE